MRRLVLSLALVAATGFSNEARHLRLTKSEPSADTTATAVTAVKLWFSQPVELGVTTIRLAADGNRNIELAALTKASREVGAPVVAGIPGTIEPGRYTVTWRTMSRDGHAVNGTFGFTLAAAAGTPANR
jgi:copper resistance protein C